MSSGRDPDAQKWFKGWYEVVIRTAVTEAGFEAILAASEEQPGAINDEIRTHLAIDPMVVVDLGGAEPEEEPNPNVMYELGIRHALGLPLVMMAWRGQRLPFDVGNQRVIMEDRDLLDLDHNRKKLISFIHAAHQGRYYRPMDAVGRVATIQAASASLTEDSVLRALVQEVRELRSTIAISSEPRVVHRREDNKLTVKGVLSSTKFRKDLYPHFLSRGGLPGDWPKVLRTPLNTSVAEQMAQWSPEEWRGYVAVRVKEFTDRSGVSSESETADIDEALVESVRSLLPSQPWPTGVHLEIADKLGIPNKFVARCINELIVRGVFMRQIDGQLFPPGDDPDG